MKSKLNITLFIIALLISLFISKTSLSSDSTLSWYLGTKKTELWALHYQLTNGQITNFFSLNSLQLKQKESTKTQLITDKTNNLAKNNNLANQSIPYDFPIAWYDSIKNLNTPSKVAQEGINLLIPYIGESSIKEIRDYLDRAEAAGIKVLVEIPRFWIRTASTDKITTFVRQFKTHPATYGWYLYDEPEYIKLSPKLLEKAYQVIKKEDPQHYITMALNRLMHTKKYLDSFDIFTYFNYPCFYDTPEFSGFEKGVFKNLAKSAASIAKNKDRFWFVIQGYGEDENGKPTKFNRRLPTIAEERYMIYSAILAQANGLLFWSHYRAQQPWINSVLTPIIQDLKTYLPAITNTIFNGSLVTNHPDIQASLYQDPNTKSLLLIAINHSNNPLNAAIAFSEDVNTNSAQVLKENRSVSIKQKMFNDSFLPYAVHIYSLNT